MSWAQIATWSLKSPIAACAKRFELLLSSAKARLEGVWPSKNHFATVFNQKIKMKANFPRVCRASPASAASMAGRDFRAAQAPGAQALLDPAAVPVAADPPMPWTCLCLHITCTGLCCDLADARLRITRTCDSVIPAHDESF